MALEREADKSNLAGLDYLEFWAYGDFLNAKFLETVERHFKQARDEYKPRYFRFGGLQFKILPTSSGPPGIYRRVYQLECNGVYLGLCKPSVTPTRPSMKVDIKGSLFMQLGEGRVLQFVKSLFHDIGFKYRESKAKRVDIRCDFQSFTVSEVAELFHSHKVVCRAKKFQSHYASPDVCETFYCAEAGSPVRCRIYDKLEQSKGDAEKMLRLEEMLGTDEIDCLTRVEFELRRKGLADRYGCDSIEDVFSSLNRITDDLTKDWLRIQRDRVSSNTNKSRDDDRKLHPIWRLVRRSFRTFAKAFQDRRVKKPLKKPHTKSHNKNVVRRFIAKIAAANETFIRSSDDVVQLIVDEFKSSGEGFSDFLKKVLEERNRIDEYRLQSAYAYFDSVNASKSTLF